MDGGDYRSFHTVLQAWRSLAVRNKRKSQLSKAQRDHHAPIAIVVASVDVNVPSMYNRYNVVVR